MDNKKETLSVIQDDNINTEDYINVYTSNINTSFKKGMFVKIKNKNVSDYMWIGQIVTSNSNMCPAISNATDQSMLVALEDRNHKADVIDGFGVDVFFKVKLLKKCYSYKVKDKTYFDFEPIDSRPLFGSKVEKLNKDEIFELLKIPNYKEFSNTSSNAFGYSQTISDLPLCLNEKNFHTHILVSGTTGSGKSNINGHIIRIAQKLNKPVIIHDAKPDFELMEFLNSESKVMFKSDRVKDREKQFKFNEIGMSNVFKIGFEGIHDVFENRNAFYDAFIFFNPSDFYPNEFAKLFFYNEDEVNSSEEFLSILVNYYEDIETGKISKKFNLETFIFNMEIAISLKKEKNKENELKLINNPKKNDDLIYALLKIHDSTLKTMIGRINRKKVKYPWLRQGGEVKKRELGKKNYTEIVKRMFDLIKNNSDEADLNKIRNYYNTKREEVYKSRSERKIDLKKNDIMAFIKDCIKDSKKTPIFLINYNFKESDITYSFIVNKLLRDIQELQDTDEAFDNGIVQVIDEAHKLFSSNFSKNVKEELLDSLNKVIKEGRVKRHSLVLSLQNASEVPNTALNNFGTKITLRQQSEAEAKISTQGMGENASKDVMNLSPGQFLIKYPSGEFTFLGFGFLSPFQLRVE